MRKRTSPPSATQARTKARVRLNSFEQFCEHQQHVAGRGPIVPIDLPEGFRAVFISRTGDESNHAHLFDASGVERAAPLINFRDDAHFAGWVVDLRKAVLAKRHTVEDFWRAHAVSIGEADPDRATRKTVEEMVYAEIDALEQAHVFTTTRAQSLRRALSPSRIRQYVLDGMTIRDMINAHNSL